MQIGDFIVAAISKTHAENEQEERSERARDIDAQERAPVTTNVQAWADDPSHLDFPGVDTPTADPVVLPKDQMDPAPTKTSAKASNEKPIEPLAPEEQESVTERAKLGATDVSLAPDEAFGDVATGSQKPRNFIDMQRAFAGGREADIAFDRAERERLFTR